MEFQYNGTGSNTSFNNGILNPARGVTILMLLQCSKSYESNFFHYRSDAPSSGRRSLEVDYLAYVPATGGYQGNVFVVFIQSLRPLILTKLNLALVVVLYDL